MRKSLVLSLFPGAGVLDGAFTREGFCVVRGPDLLWGMDISNFHPPEGRFEGVIAGIPAKLVHEFNRVVDEVRPKWWVAEIGQGAELPAGWQSERVIGPRRFLWSGLVRVPLLERMANVATNHKSATAMAEMVSING